MYNLYLNLVLYGYGLTFLLMLFLWLFYLKTNKPMVVDVGWGFGIALIGFFFALTCEGFFLRKYILGLMISIWGLRLGLHLLYDRIIGSHHDARYDMLEKKWKTNLKLKYFFFYQFQALIIIIMLSPLLPIYQNKNTQFTYFEFIGFFIWIIALVGVTLSDMQLKNFKKIESNKGKVCRVGLWNYSRHPNYFFEWLAWISFFVFSISSSYGWISLLPSLIMLYLLFNVTGIPLTEKRAIESRGNEYIKYQKETSKFFIWFNKNK